MKILKSGTEKTYKITCNKCRSDLEYTLADITETEFNSDFLTLYQTNKKTYRADAIRCLNCGNKIRV